jgi:hypothetical protein
MKDLVLYQCRKCLESMGEISDGQNSLLLANASEANEGALISYLKLLGFTSVKQTDGNGEKTTLLTGDGDVSISLAYSESRSSLRLTVQEK